MRAVGPEEKDHVESTMNEKCDGPADRRTKVACM